jgi:hypothetical protein
VEAERGARQPRPGRPPPLRRPTAPNPRPARTRAAEPRAAEVVGRVEAAEAELCRAAQRVDGELRGGVPAGGVGREVLAREGRREGCSWVGWARGVVWFESGRCGAFCGARARGAPVPSRAPTHPPPPPSGAPWKSSCSGVSPSAPHCCASAGCGSGAAAPLTGRRASGARGAPRSPRAPAAGGQQAPSDARAPADRAGRSSARSMAGGGAFGRSGRGESREIEFWGVRACERAIGDNTFDLTPRTQRLSFPPKSPGRPAPRPRPPHAWPRAHAHARGALTPPRAPRDRGGAPSGSGSAAQRRRNGAWRGRRAAAGSAADGPRRRAAPAGPQGGRKWGATAGGGWGMGDGGAQARRAAGPRTAGRGARARPRAPAAPPSPAHRTRAAPIP